MKKKIITAVISAVLATQGPGMYPILAERLEGTEYDHVELAYDPVVNFTPGGTVDFTDIEDEKTLINAELLAFSEIVSVPEDGLFRPKDNITRYEFAEMVLRASDSDIFGLYSSSMNGFYDVKRDSYEEKVLSVGAGKGIISGYSDNSFHPDDEISYNDAITMLMRASGYETYAQMNGGYPYGYSAAASYAGVSTALKNSQTLTRAEAAALFSDWLESDVLKNSVNASKSDFTTGDSVMKAFLSIDKSTGVVEANSITALKGNIVSDGLMIDGVIYNNGRQDYDSYLGYKVDFYYYTQGEQENEILYMHKNDKVKTISFSSDDYIGINKNIISYYSNEKSKTATIDSLTDVIVNGVKVSPKSYSEVLSIKEGTIVLLSNDGSSKYNTMFITGYENFYLSGVSATNDTVTFNFGYNMSKLEVDLNQNVKLDIFDAAGGKIEYLRTNADTGETAYDLSKIPAGSVVSFSADKYITRKSYIIPAEDATYIKATVSSNKLEAKATGITDEGYIIGNKYVKLSQSNLTQEDDSKIKIGSVGTFYLDFMGELVCFLEGEVTGVSENEIQAQYGYLINGYLDDTVDTVSFKIMNTSGIIKSYTNINSIVINKKRKKAAEAIDNLRISAKLGSPTDIITGNVTSEFDISQLVKFKENAEGALTELETILAGENDDNYLSLDVPCRGYYRYDDDTTWALISAPFDENQSITKNRYAGYFAPQYIFTVPNTQTKIDSDYSVGIEDETFSAEPMQFYDVSFDKTPAVAVRYVNAGDTTDKLVKTNRDRPMAVMIKEICDIVDENENFVKSITVVTGEAEKTYTSDVSGIESDFKPGDMVRLYTNDLHNNISKMEHIKIDGQNVGASYKLNLENSAAWDSYSSNNYVPNIYGEVYAKNGRKFIIQTGPVVDSVNLQRERQVTGYVAQYEYMFGGIIVYDDTGDTKDPIIKAGKIDDVKTVYEDGAENASIVFFYPEGGTGRIYVFYNLKNK